MLPCANDLARPATTARRRCCALATVLVCLAAATALATPTDFELLSPANGQTSVDVWPHFEWEESTDPTGVTYTIKIGTNATFTPGTFVQYDGITETEFWPPVDLVMADTYYWIVIAVSGDGIETIGSTPGTFFDSFQFATQGESIERTLHGYEPLTRERTLIPDNNPYHVRDGDFFVEADGQLNIAAGSIVKVEDGIGIYLDGLFRSLGTEAANVTITSTHESPASMSWKGLEWRPWAPPAQFDGDGHYLEGQIIEYTHVQHGGYGTTSMLRVMTPVFVSHVRIADESTSVAVIDIENTSGAVIADCEFTNITVAHNMGAFSLDNAHDAIVRDNVFTNCGVMTSGTINAMLTVQSDDVLVSHNEFIDCFAESTDRSVIGGAFICLGTGLVLEYNRFIGCSAIPSSNSSFNATGGAVVIVSDGVAGSFEVIGNHFENNFATHKSYGGAFFANGHSGGILRDNTFTGNEARYGGAVYDWDHVLDIRHNTFTANHSSVFAGAIYGGRKILDNIIKDNTCELSTEAGGIYTFADSVCFNNISNNENFDLRVYGDNEVIATENWWLTRNESGISARLWDEEDDQNLGRAYYSPVLEYPSSSAPYPFAQVLSIEPKADGTYSTPLDEAPCLGDTLFFTITGVDSNPYNRDVAVATVANMTSPDWVDPYFEETGYDTGVFNGYCLLAEQTDPDPPFPLTVQPGDLLHVVPQVDYSFFFEVNVCGPVELVACFTYDDLPYFAPCDVAFSNCSEGMIDDVLWDFGDGATSTEWAPVHHYAAGGIYTVTLTVNGSDESDFFTDTVEIGTAAPILLDVTDVPDDQGLWVFVDFQRSGHDTDPLTLAEIYTVERLDGEDWTAVGHSSAYAQSTYRVQVPTLVDAAETTFRVIASMDEGTFASNEMAGMSEDNILPGQPQNVAWISYVELGWSAVDAPDLAMYRVYGGDTDVFDDAEAVADVETTSYDFGGSPEYAYYFVVAVDDADQESAPSEPAAITAVGDDLPQVLSLTNHPNPFNPMTAIVYALPTDGTARLEVYDVAGCRVRVLHDGAQVRGRHEVVWNGRDDHGRGVPSGTYLYRLVTDGGTLTRRMLLVK